VKGLRHHTPAEKPSLSTGNLLGQQHVSNACLRLQVFEKHLKTVYIGRETVLRGDLSLLIIMREWEGVGDSVVWKWPVQPNKHFSARSQIWPIDAQFTRKTTLMHIPDKMGGLWTTGVPFQRKAESTCVKLLTYRLVLRVQWLSLSHKVHLTRMHVDIVERLIAEGLKFGIMTGRNRSASMLCLLSLTQTIINGAAGCSVLLL